MLDGSTAKCTVILLCIFSSDDVIEVLDGSTAKCTVILQHIFSSDDVIEVLDGSMAKSRILNPDGLISLHLFFSTVLLVS